MLTGREARCSQLVSTGDTESQGKAWLLHSISQLNTACTDWEVGYSQLVSTGDTESQGKAWLLHSISQLNTACTDWEVRYSQLVSTADTVTREGMVTAFNITAEYSMY